MKVYILFQDSYEYDGEGSVAGVYSSLDKAIKAKEEEGGFLTYSILEWEVDGDGGYI